MQIDGQRWKPYTIFSAVAERGGFDAVCEAGLWREVAEVWTDHFKGSAMRTLPQVTLLSFPRQNPSGCHVVGLSSGSRPMFCGHIRTGYGIKPSDESENTFSRCKTGHSTADVSRTKKMWLWPKDLRQLLTFNGCRAGHSTTAFLELPVAVFPQEIHIQLL